FASDDASPTVFALLRRHASDACPGCQHFVCCPTRLAQPTPKPTISDPPPAFSLGHPVGLTPHRSLAIVISFLIERYSTKNGSPQRLKLSTLSLRTRLRSSSCSLTRRAACA